MTGSPVQQGCAQHPFFAQMVPAGREWRTLEQVAAELYEACRAVPRLQVSFSGGRSSALLAKLAVRLRALGVEVVFTFANTGREHPDTLRFVDDVDRTLGLNLVWLEAVVYPGKRKSSTARVVDYATACRDGERFREVVAKYGLPNRTFKLCTRELKQRPMDNYIRKHLGWRPGSYKTALGIRADENRRVADSAAAQSIVYPLAHWWPVDKQDVLDHWEGDPIDLTIDEFEGNCLECHQKSDVKLMALHQRMPEAFEFPIMLDRLYTGVGPNTRPGPRRRYRLERTTEQLIAGFSTLKGYEAARLVTEGGCSESCEVYETVAVEEPLA